MPGRTPRETPSPRSCLTFVPVLQVRFASLLSQETNMGVSSDDFGGSTSRSKWAVTRLAINSIHQSDSSPKDAIVGLRGLTVLTCLLGLPPLCSNPVSTTTANRLRRVSQMTVLIVLSYGLHLMAATACARKMLTPFVLLIAVGNVMRMLTSFVSIIQFSLCRGTIVDILGDVQRIFRNLPSGLALKARRFSMILGGLCVTSCLLLLTSALVPVLNRPLQGFYDVRVYAVNCSRIPAAARLLPVFLDLSMLSLFSSATTSAVCIFVCVCHYLSLVTQNFKRKIRVMLELSTQGKLKTDAVRDTLLRLSRITDAVFRLNQTYGPILFWWYMDLIRSFLLSIPAVLVAVTSSLRFSEYGFVLLDLARDVVTFLLMSFVASDMARNVFESIVDALRAADSMDNEQMDLRVAVQMEILVTTIQDANVQLSGWEFFHVDRSLMNRVLSLVATFVIVVYQFLT